MLLIEGSAAGTTLTGTLYEPGERPPAFAGAPDEAARYVWVCDEVYPVASGGAVQRLEDRELNIAFEPPLARGFDDREGAMDAAAEHLRTQFARLGVATGVVEVRTESVDPEPR